jgi:hypothetical protein
MWTDPYVTDLCASNDSVNIKAIKKNNGFVLDPTIEIN